MPTYTPPVRDMQFLLDDVHNMSQYSDLPGFEEATPDLVGAILEEGGKLAQEALQPINQSGDHEGCKLDSGAVTTPSGFKEAYQTYVDGGWGGLTGDAEYGGQGLPYVLGLAMNEMCCAANMSFSMYPGLTHGAIDALELHGSEALKALYLPKLISGEWTGTMNLTEAHAGTDLGLIRTKAEPQADGSYRLNGTKIFISAGEHDLTENIIHLVLARLPDAPEGVKGISLFLVPKILVNEDGSLADANGVSCGSIEEKLGIHGNCTCVLNFDDSVGYLVGEANKGLKAMFTMMNAARLGVAVQGLALSQVAYENAVTYAQDRIQMRSLTGVKAPDKAADPIIVHPDIRRMLMTTRAFTEGARSLAYWSGLQVDLARKHPDEKTRVAADDLLGLMTPVMKAYFTDMGFVTTNMCLQVYGGHGYIREWGMEQFTRDARIAQIYEGANGIQALDLVGRKLPSGGGRAIGTYFATVGGFLEVEVKDEALAPYCQPVLEALEHQVTATEWLMENGMKNPDNAAAGSTDYLYIMGLVTLGWQWAVMAKVALAKLAAGEGDAQFYKGKLATAKFFMDRMLPDTAAHLAKLQSGADSTMALADEAF